MNLPKKKFAFKEDLGTIQIVEDAVPFQRNMYEPVLDSEGMKQLANYWKETIHLRSMHIRHYTDLARDMERKAFEYLEE